MRRLAICGVLLAGTVPAQVTEQADPLPSVECVRMIRAARGMLESGDRQGGVKLLRETTERFPDDVVSLMALWDFHKRYGLPEEEAGPLRKTLTERLKDPDDWLPPGVVGYLAGNPDADEEELRLLLEAISARLAGDDVEILRAAVIVQQRLELHEQARDTLERLRKLSPSKMLDWRCILLDLELERWAAAATGLKSVLGREEAGVGTRLMYIDVLSRLGRQEEMLREIDLLSTDNPLMNDMINGLLTDAAWNLRDAGDDDGAESLFRRILALDSGNRQALTAILHLYGTEEELQAHRAALQSAHAEETDPYVLMEQGGNLLAAGDAEQALALLQRAAPGLPDNENAWYNLGLAALQLERWAIAESAFLRASEINPGRVDSLLSRGTALQKLGRCPAAIQLLNEALKLAPDRTQAHYYLYACYVEMEDHEAAREALRRYNER